MFKVSKTENEIFYFNSLFKEYIFNFSKLEKFFSYDYRKLDNYFSRQQCLNKSFNHNHRQEIYKILKENNLELGAGKETLANIEKIKSAESLVVIGGQQPGLFSGPIFIIYKILTVLKLSEFFEKELNVPVIPCFWNASDDDQIQQVNKIKLLNGNIKQFIIRTDENLKGKRYSDIYVPIHEIEDIYKNILEFIKKTDFTDDLVIFFESLLRDELKKTECSKKSINLPLLFSLIMTKLFKARGLVLIDPNWAEIKKSGLNLINFDLRNNEKISEIINSIGENLKYMGFHKQLNSISRTYDFFISENGIREKVYFDKNGIVKSGKRLWSEGKLLDYARLNSNKFSFNVVLRPVLQDTLLPVLCTVCGPGEVSYFAQLKEVYKMFGIDMPIIYPRLSATIVEKKISKIISKYKINFNELTFKKDSIIKEAVKNNMPLNPDLEIIKLEKSIIELTEKLKNDFLYIKNNTGSPFERFERNIHKEISVLEKKIISEARNHQQELLRGFDNIYNNLFPDDNLQEREINIISYLNKYGFGFIDEIYEILKPLDFGHNFLEIV